MPSQPGLRQTYKDPSGSSRVRNSSTNFARSENPLSTYRFQSRPHVSARERCATVDRSWPKLYAQRRAAPPLSWSATTPKRGQRGILVMGYTYCTRTKDGIQKQVRGQNHASARCDCAAKRPSHLTFRRIRAYGAAFCLFAM